MRQQTCFREHKLTASSPGDLLGHVVVVDHGELRDGRVRTAAMLAAARRVEPANSVRPLLQRLSRVDGGTSSGRGARGVCSSGPRSLLACARGGSTRG